jgi:hypothetical protein
MLRRVNPMLLLSLIIVLILSFGIFASAQVGVNPVTGMGGASGSADVQPVGSAAADALGVGEAQLGKPFVMGTDGPGTFSCSGLMRYILRTTGVDENAPWVPEEYLSRYTLVDLVNVQPGDIVIMPNWATMYVGNGMLLNANEVLGTVTHTPLIYAGAPLGAVRPPYAGSQSGATQPLNDETRQLTAKPMTTEPAVTGQVPTEQPVAVDPLMTADPLMASDPLVASDPLMAGPLAVEQPAAVEPVAVELVMTTEPVATELPAHH